MRIETHANNTEKLYGWRADEIHIWIDQYFDHDKFIQPFRRWIFQGWSPYDHRRHLHNIESLPRAVEAFKGKYPEDVIVKVFIQHLKDDYGGYVPVKSDFSDPAFLRKYHNLIGRGPLRIRPGLR